MTCIFIQLCKWFYSWLRYKP